MCCSQKMDKTEADIICITKHVGFESVCAASWFSRTGNIMVLVLFIRGEGGLRVLEHPHKAKECS